MSPEERMDLHWAVAQLPERSTSDVVKLKYFDDCTIREISQATGMPGGDRLRLSAAGHWQAANFVEGGSVCERNVNEIQISIP